MFILGRHKAVAALSLVLCLFASKCHGMIYTWDFDEEERKQFPLEMFGFATDGSAEITISDVKIDYNSASADHKGTAGIAIKYADDLQQLAAHFEDDGLPCLLHEVKAEDKVDLLGSSLKLVKHIDGDSRPGFYVLFFSRCGNDIESVSFKMTAKLLNPGPNYLSIGDSPVPTLYGVFFFVFLAMTLFWLRVVRQQKDKVHQIHKMMALLIIFKTFASGAESLRYHYIKTQGDPLGWNIIYYIFAFLKGIMMFVVILLIGSGWSLLKPYLSDREKKIIMTVLILQVVDNIALIVFEESSPGSLKWLHWREILNFIDIICCCAILFPIVWSIRQLRQGVRNDGKAQVNLQKLTQFRQFYISVVSYIYFTRIAVFLVAATLPYNLTWLKVFFTEGATVVFYGVVGSKFRPAMQNSYLPVASKFEEDLEEFGLNAEEDGFDIQRGGGEGAKDRA